MDSSHEKVYLFESKQIFKMNKQYDVLDTIPYHLDDYVQSSYTNIDGILFLITYTGKVLSFDPLGFYPGSEKKPIEIADLERD